MTKSEARRYFKAQRAALLETELREHSKKLHDILFSRLMMHRYSPIHLFLPILSKKEPDTQRIVSTLRKDFSPDLYISCSLENGELLHLKFEPNTVLTTNKWGVDEPKDLSQALSTSDFFDTYKNEDILVIVPLLAFDKKGNRVGYGKGYYDKFLQHATKNTTIVGLSFFEPIDLIKDTDQFDVKMNFCVTPNRVWQW